MFQPESAPIGGSLTWSALVAALPLLVMFVLLGGFRLKAPIAAVVGLGAAATSAWLVYSMPLGQVLSAGALGFAYGMFPIMWLILNAIWIYNLTVETGHFNTLRRSMASISPDQRIQAVIIAFCFGALIEGLAGFGTPVAITSVMLIAVGFKPMKAAALALVANTAPVAFASMGIPIVTLAGVTGMPFGDLGAMVGRQTPVVAFVVPFILVGMVGGWRGVREVWPAALVGGSSYAIAQFVCSNYVSVELTDIAASLIGAGAIVLLLRVWQPKQLLVAQAEERDAAVDTGSRDDDHPVPSTGPQGGRGDVETLTARDTRQDVALAYAPYILIIAVFGLSLWGPIATLLSGLGTKFAWPGLHIADSAGAQSALTVFKLNIGSTAGTLLFASGLITMAILKVSPARALRAYATSAVQLKNAALTVGLVLALAYVLNLSGQTTTLGLWIAGAGGLLGIVSPITGWLGVTVTGSDTASNSLFGALQVNAANAAGLNANLLAAANSSGGVIGKMLSPQSLAIAAAAVGLKGKEGDLFRSVFGWSMLLLLLMCILVYLQTTPLLSWMVV